jgi:hypothetical protein
MSRNSGSSFPVLGTIFDVVAILFNLLSGFVLGLIAPVVAVAAIVAGIRSLTGQVPFLGAYSKDEEGARQLSLRLMSTEQARAAYEDHKEAIGGDLAWMKDEIQSIIQEAKAEAEAGASVAQEEDQAPNEI